MRHFLFEDYDSGEMFIVGAWDRYDAEDIAASYFADPHYEGEMTEFQAEMSGLDEY